MKNLLFDSFCIISAFRSTENVQIYIDIFLPFLAKLLKENRYQPVEGNAEKFCSDFLSEFGISFPYHPMCSLLNRAVKLELLSRKNGILYPNQENLSRYTEKQEYDFTKDRLQSVIIRYIHFCEQMEIEINEEEAKNEIIEFIHRNSTAILLDGRDIFTSQDASVKYRIARFFMKMFENDSATWESMKDIAIASITLSSVNIPSSYVSNTLAGVEVFIDTPFILRLLGYQNDFSQKSCDFLLNLIQVNGGSCYVFPQTYDEIYRVIDAARHWVHNPYYDPSRASDVIVHFVTKGLSTNDIDEALERLKYNLASYDITLYDKEIPSSCSPLLIDKEWLYSEMTKLSPSWDYEELDFSKWGRITHNVEIINSIYSLRGNRCKKSINECKYMVLTTNSLLASLIRKQELQKNHDAFPAVITDVYLGTRLWSQTPSQTDTDLFVSWKLLASCTVALEPSRKLKAAFVATVNAKRAKGDFTEEETFLIKTAGTFEHLLANKTNNDVALHTDKTLDQIFKESADHIVIPLKKENARKTSEIYELKKVIRRTNFINRTRAKIIGTVLSIVIALIPLFVIFICQVYGNMFLLSQVYQFMGHIKH